MTPMTEIAASLRVNRPIPNYVSDVDPQIRRVKES